MLSKRSKKSKKNKLNDNLNEIVVVVGTGGGGGGGGSTSADITSGDQFTNNTIQSSSDTKKQPLKESKKSISSSNTRKISTSSSTTPTLNRRFNDFIELIRHRFNNTTSSSSSSSKRHSKKQRSKQAQHVDNQLTTQTSKQDNNNLDINDDNNNLSPLTCQLCCNEYETNESFFHLNTCKHQFCINCLRTYLKYQISESRTAISCPKCQEKMQQSDIYQLLTDYNRTLIDKYEEFMIRRVLLTIPDVRFCPAPDCTYAIIASGCANCPQLQCERPGCNTAFCYHCKQLWHPNLTCEDAARLNPFGSSATSSATAAAILGLNRSNSHISIASYALVSGNSSQQKDEMKYCPKCRSPIVKMDDGSCNHMTCPVCGCEFCWLCMKEISDLHYLSPSGCTFWGKKPWSRKKKILWQLGTLIGAPVGIALVASVAIPAIIIGLPIWSGRKVYLRFKNSNKHKRNIIVVTTVVGSILVAPIIAALTVGIGVPILLAYVYGVVPISLCRSGGCGVTTNENGGVRLSFDDQDTITFSNTNNNIMNNLPTNTTTTTNAVASSSGGPSSTSAATITVTTTTTTSSTNNRISQIPQQQQQQQQPKTVDSPTIAHNVNSNPVVSSSSTTTATTTSSTTSANSKCVDLINNMATVSASIQTDISKNCNLNNINSTRCSNDISNKCKITSKSKTTSTTPPTTTTTTTINNQQYHKFSSSCGSVLSETDKMVTLKHNNNNNNNNNKNDSHSVNTQNNPSSIGDASIGDRASVNTDRNEYFVYDVDLGDRDSASNKALAGSSKRITFKDNHDYRDMDDDDEDEDEDDDDGLTKKYDIKSYDSYSITTTSEKSNNPSVIALAGSIKDNQSIKSADNNLDTTTATSNQNNNNNNKRSTSPTTHKTILITQVL